jgi:hypothetical protein
MHSSNDEVNILVIAAFERNEKLHLGTKSSTPENNQYLKRFIKHYLTSARILVAMVAKDRGHASTANVPHARSFHSLPTVTRAPLQRSIT